MAIIQTDPNFQLETNRDHEHDTGISLQHDLNREKQVDKLIFNTNRETIVIEINCNDQNVTSLECDQFRIVPAMFRIVPVMSGTLPVMSGM